MKSALPGYVPTLDGWRAIAILGVIIAHGSDANFEPHGVWHGLTRYGAMGVDIFFGISGLLICMRLLEEHQKNGRISLGGFYIRRTCRILPACLAYLALVGLLGAMGVLVISKWELWSSLLFWRNYLAPHDLGGWYTGHLWSLAVEEHFYLLWPALLILLTPRRAVWVVPLLALALAGWRVMEFRYQWVPRALPGVGFYVRTDIRLDSLLWGCWAALVVLRTQERLTQWFSPGVWFVMFAGLVVCVALKPPLALLWQSLLIPAILVGTILQPDGRAGWLLESPPMRWIGRISYSLYLWHVLFLVGKEVTRPLPLGLLQEWPLNILAVFACATLSYYAIERPMIRLGHRLAPLTTQGSI